MGVDDNYISEQGFKAIANGLKENYTLVTLNIGKNKLQYKGATALGEALIHNNTLNILDLSTIYL